MAQFAWFSVLASGGRDRRKRRHGRLGVDASFHEDGNANEARTSPRDRVRSENRDLLRRTEGVDVVDCGLQRAARVAPRDDTTPGANLELAAHSASSAVAESPLEHVRGGRGLPGSWRMLGSRSRTYPAVLDRTKAQPELRSQVRVDQCELGARERKRNNSNIWHRSHMPCHRLSNRTRHPPSDDLGRVRAGSRPVAGADVRVDSRPRTRRGSRARSERSSRRAPCRRAGETSSARPHPTPSCRSID